MIRSPLAARRSPLAARRSPLAARRSPLAGLLILVVGTFPTVSATDPPNPRDHLAVTVFLYKPGCGDDYHFQVVNTSTEYEFKVLRHGNPRIDNGPQACCTDNPADDNDGSTPPKVLCCPQGGCGQPGGDPTGNCPEELCCCDFRSCNQGGYGGAESELTYSGGTQDCVAGVPQGMTGFPQCADLDDDDEDGVPDSGILDYECDNVVCGDGDDWCSTILAPKVEATEWRERGETDWNVYLPSWVICEDMNLLSLPSGTRVPPYCPFESQCGLGIFTTLCAE